MIFGGDGNDSISSTGGYVEGGAGNDLINADSGGGGNNTVLGGDGNDTISGRLTSNVNAFDQTYFGGEGDDSLVGSVWGDTLSGGAGNDTLSNFGGRIGDTDFLSGGAGADVFVILSGVIDVTSNMPLDPPRIIDWEQVDRIDFSADRFEAGTAANYREITATSIDALNTAARDLHDQGVFYVAAQIGADVAIIGTSSTFQHAGVLLVGQTLADISFANFI